LKILNLSDSVSNYHALIKNVSNYNAVFEKDNMQLQKYKEEKRKEKKEVMIQTSAITFPIIMTFLKKTRCSYRINK
jgi:hypothetical protein